MPEKNVKILIIDDDEDFRSYVFDLIKSRGFDAFVAANGKKGVDILEKEKIDIILTDLVMHEKEGIDTIMDTKKKHPNIKIIAMSGAIYYKTYLKLAKMLRADVILPKPFKKQEMFDAIEKVCKG